MKPYFSFLSLFIGISAASTSIAAPNTCTDVEALYNADSISLSSDSCATPQCKSRQALQTRAAAQLLGKVYDPNWSDDEVYKKYGPGYSNLNLGSEHFNGIALCEKNDCPIYFFIEGTTILAPVMAMSYLSSSDDSLEVFVGGQKCTAPLSPLNSPSRRAELCRQVENRLKTVAPQMKVTAQLCLDSNSTFVLATEDDNLGFADIFVMRDMSDVAEGTFACKAKLNRSTEQMNNLDCYINE